MTIEYACHSSESRGATRLPGLPNMGRVVSATSRMELESADELRRRWPQPIILGAFLSWILAVAIWGGLGEVGLNVSRELLFPIWFLFALPTIWYLRPRQLLSVIAEGGYALLEQSKWTPRPTWKLLRFADLTAVTIDFRRVFDAKQQRYQGTKISLVTSIRGKRRVFSEAVMTERELGTDTLDRDAAAGLFAYHPAHFIFAAETAWQTWSQAN